MVTIRGERMQLQNVLKPQKVGVIRFLLSKMEVSVLLKNLDLCIITKPMVHRRIAPTMEKVVQWQMLFMKSTTVIISFMSNYLV